MASVTRKYLAVMGAIVLMATAIWLSGRDSRVDELNEQLHAAFPELAGKNVQEPAMMAAQDELVRKQSRAAASRARTPRR